MESVWIIHGPGRTSAPSTRKFSVRFNRVGSGVGRRAFVGRAFASRWAWQAASPSLP